MRSKRPTDFRSVETLPFPSFSLLIMVTKGFLNRMEKTVPWKESVNTKDELEMYLIQFSTHSPSITSYPRSGTSSAVAPLTARGFIPRRSKTPLAFTKVDGWIM